MDFLKLLEEYENYKRGFGIEPKSSGHSACVDFAIWLNNNASLTPLAPDAGDSEASSELVQASALSTSQAEPTPTQRG